MHPFKLEVLNSGYSEYMRIAQKTLLPGPQRNLPFSELSFSNFVRTSSTPYKQQHRKL